MSGIAGIIDKEKGVNKRLLERMRDALTHRGPDDTGIWISVDKTIGLAHCRLSIIDLSHAGHQPMSDGKGEVWITYGGETYNFTEIKKELETKGYKFKSKTDTEVVLYAYEEWGIECIHRFNGMFAFCIYDVRKKKLFMARDRAGNKPFYYAQYNGKFIFASELKAILCDPEFPREIDYRALNFYLTFGYIPFDFCIYKYARKLPPAQMMIYDKEKNDCKIMRYWEVPLPDRKKHKEGELLEQLEYYLKDAIKLRLISDVPLGAFLSGGIDSSLVVAMMSMVSGKPVKTFSIGFEEQKYNELSYAKIVADYFGTKHTELIVKQDSFCMLGELVKHFDEPFADSSMIPTYYVSKMAKNYVTVTLSGDGGDELFGGYSSYFGTLGNFYLSKIFPLFLRRGVSRYTELLPEKLIGKRQLLRLQYDPYMAFIDRMSHWHFKDRYRKKVLSPEIMNLLGAKYHEPELILHDILQSAKTDFLNSLEMTDFISSLPEDGLTKVDRTSMKVSLEVRCPLLDFRIVEFAFKMVRGSLKIRGLKKKYLLKKLAKKMLPSELNLNRKQGFAVPISEWFRGELESKMTDILLGSKSLFFNQGYIYKLLKEHKAGIDHSTRLFTLIVFRLWENEYL